MKKRRTQKRFKYRNAAVMQGTILGNEKLVLVTCAEFAHDDGAFWHGVRSLSKATGLSRSTVARCIESLRDRGILYQLERGFSARHASKYRIILSNIPEKPSVYDLVRHDPEMQKNDRPTQRRSESSASHTETLPSPSGTKDIDLDVDVVFVDRDRVGDTPTPPCDDIKVKVQPERQNQQVVLGELSQATSAAAAQPSAANRRPAYPPSKATPRLCADCRKRPLWRGQWCDHCHTDGPHAQ